MSAELRDPHVLVAVDGSEPSLQAARWAAATAKQRQETLLVAYVVDFSASYASATYPVPEIAYMPKEYVEAVTENGQAVTREAVAVVEREHPGLKTQTVEPVGSPTEKLLELSQEASLTVLGATGRGGFSRMLLGSVAMAVVTRSAKPVAIVRPGEDGTVPTEGPVVVGIDGSELSEAAVAAAFEEASHRGADLVAVAVLDLHIIAYPAMFEEEEAKAEEEEVLAERLAGWAERYPDVKVRRAVVLGPPVRTLLECTQGAQLVVVGSRGHGEFTGALLGSVSRALVHHAPCPVLVTQQPNE